MPTASQGARPAANADTLILRSYLVGATVLRYDPSTGACEEVLRRDLPQNVREHRGFYIRAQDVFVGIYASPSGPVLFRDGERFPLRGSGIRLERNSLGRGRYAFVMRDEGRIRFTIRYGEHLISPPVDCWSAELEDRDFFVWLVRATSPDFQTSFTTRAITPP
jgi:hypothetical protein